MTAFYRYIRPVKFNEHRVELETLPHGGICLRFDENEDGTLWFTFSRCHSDELFSKEVAKRIADNRAKAAHSAPRHELCGSLTPSKVTEVLVEQVIDWCEAWTAPIDTRWYVTGLYLEQEYRALARALELLVASNLSEKHKADVWKEGLAAIDTRELYASNFSAQAPGNSYD